MNPRPIKTQDQEARQAVAEAPLNIYARMVSILSDLDAIGKNSKNLAQGFNYRGIDDVYNAINPLLAKHGVFMTAQIMGKTREERTNAKGTVLAFTCLHMRYHFHGEDGSSLATEAEGEGMDSGDKSSNKAMAVAHKYALLQAFCIPTKDLDDPDKDSHEVEARLARSGPVTEEQAEHIFELLTKDNADVPGFCKYMGITSIIQLPASQYTRAIEVINTRSQKVKAKQA